MIIISDSGVVWACDPSNGESGYFVVPTLKALCVSAIGQLEWDRQTETWGVSGRRGKNKELPKLPAIDDLRVCDLSITFVLTIRI